MVNLHGEPQPKKGDYSRIIDSRIIFSNMGTNLGKSIPSQTFGPNDSAVHDSAKTASV
jgi:hypothetical protein